MTSPQERSEIKQQRYEFEDQMHRASCLHLIMVAIAAWNAVYLSQAIEALKKQSEIIPEEYLPHITSLPLMLIDTA